MISYLCLLLLRKTQLPRAHSHKPKLWAHLTYSSVTGVLVTVEIVTGQVWGGAWGPVFLTGS